MSAIILNAKKTGQVVLRSVAFNWHVSPGLFTVTAIVTHMQALTPLANLYLIKTVIDYVVLSVQLQYFDQYKMFYFGFIWVGLYFLESLLNSTYVYLSRVFWLKQPFKLEQLVLTKINHLDSYYFENDKFRDLLQKVRETLWSNRLQQFSELQWSLLRDIIVLGAAVIALIQVKWFFLLIIIISLIPAFADQLNRSKIAWGIWEGDTVKRKEHNYLLNILQNYVQIKELKIYSLSQHFLDKLKVLRQSFLNQNYQLAVTTYRFSFLYNLFQTATSVGLSLKIVLEALASRITIGDVSFYIGLINRSQNAVSSILGNSARVYDLSLYLTNIFQLMDLKPTMLIPKPGVKLLSDHPPLIEFKSVSFTYPETKHQVLVNFNLTIQPGEKIAFVGENGAGKSTIIKLLARFYDIDSGEILINGHNLKELDLDSWYGQIGALFQDFNRYQYTAADNIRFGNIDASHHQDLIVKAAHLAGADSMIDGFANGYDQMLGKTFDSGIELSGGQWQKVALARAFFRDAPILVLDEPTASIDAKAESEIFSRVEKLSRNKTVIIISHRFSTVRNADKIYVLDKGKIIESGSHEQLIEANGHYAKLFNLQAKGYK